MKIVIAPDSFKHTMSAFEVCDIIGDAISETMPEAQILKLPVADGGEGTIDAVLSVMGCRKIYHRVKGPELDEVESYYGLIDGGIAIIEMATICGLMMVSVPNPEVTTSFGVGQMIKKALDDGCTKIILCIGGSATNDGGIGALAALGVGFLDTYGKGVIPSGGNLSGIASIDSTKIDPRLSSCEITIACDVNNPLYGENGAAHVFAPQKGADADMVLRLDDGLRHYAEILCKHINRDVSQIPGSGAAGGIAASFIGFCNAHLKRGVDIVLDVIEFDKHITDADLIITGEGKTDLQTLGGKVVLGVAGRARGLNIPVIVISGAVDDDVDELLYNEGITAVFACTRLAVPFEDIKDKCRGWLRLTAKNVMKVYAANGQA